MDNPALLRLLQLTSPALPVGAFSYSEGLETLVHQGWLADAEAVGHWLTQELRYGAVRLEGAVVLRSHQAHSSQNTAELIRWNQWLSATRETQELRQQSWQMGRALVRTLEQLHPELQPVLAAVGRPCNFAVAFGLTAAHWQIPAQTALLGYLQSWGANLVAAAIKLVPLGQTAGQGLQLQLIPELAAAAEEIAELADDELATSGWGPGLASMAHETLYSRLFRS